jgi:putative serine protease PepD
VIRRALLIVVAVSVVGGGTAVSKSSVLDATTDATLSGARAGAGPWSSAAGSGVLAGVATGDLIKSTVQILLLSSQPRPGAQAYGWGSGTIIAPNGLILTNAHVAKPTAEGLGIASLDPAPATDPVALVVALTEAEDAPPVQRYLARTVAADGYLDAALIQIDRTIDGASVSPGALNLPTVPIGDSDALSVGQGLTVVGFPGIGGDTVSLSTGRVSGFLGDDRIGNRAWIKTDATVSSGNSGGLAASETRQLVGIPTLGNAGDVGGYSLLRPINLVKPMIDAAQAGRPSLDSPYVANGTGTEAVTFATWTDSVSNCEPASRVVTYSSGAREMVALFGDRGLAKGEDVLAQWRYQGGIVHAQSFQIPDASREGSCFWISLSHDRGLPDGDYRLDIFVGPGLKQVSTAQTTVGTRSGGGSAAVEGRIVDADSRQPVAGAILVFLSPGTDPAAWLNNPSEASVVTYGETDVNGRYEIGGLVVGETYPAIAGAQGYSPTTGTIGPIAEGVTTLTDTTIVRSP